FSGRGDAAKREDRPQSGATRSDHVGVETVANHSHLARLQSPEALQPNVKEAWFGFAKDDRFHTGYCLDGSEHRACAGKELTMVDGQQRVGVGPDEPRASPDVARSVRKFLVSEGAIESSNDPVRVSFAISDEGEPGLVGGLVQPRLTDDAYPRARLGVLSDI